MKVLVNTNRFKNNFKTFLELVVVFGCTFFLHLSLTYANNICSDLFKEQSKFELPNFDQKLISRGGRGVSLRDLYENHPRLAMYAYLKAILLNLGPVEFVKKFYKHYHQGKYQRSGSIPNPLTFLEKVDQINKSWQELVIYPPLIQNMSYFFSLVEKYGWHNLDPSEVYQKYIEHDPPVTLYRALVIDNAISIESLRSKSLWSGYMQKQFDSAIIDGTLEKKIISFGDRHDRSPMTFEEKIKKWGSDWEKEHMWFHDFTLAERRIYPISEAIFNHYGQLEGNFILSVTQDKELAIRVANYVMNSKQLKNHRVLVWTIQMRPGEIINPEAGGFYSYPKDAPTKEVESFIYGGVSSNEISSID